MKGLPGYAHINAELDVKTTTNANEKARQLADGEYDTAIIHVRRGLASYTKQEYRKAIADATQAIAINPRLAAAYHLRANAYTHAMALDSALADLNQAIKLNPNFALAYFNRGQLHRMALVQSVSGDPGGANARLAIADLSEAVRLDPDMARRITTATRSPKGRARWAIGDCTKVSRSSGKTRLATRPRSGYCGTGRKDAHAEKKVVELGGRGMTGAMGAARLHYRNERGLSEKSTHRLRIIPLPGEAHWQPFDPIAPARERVLTALRFARTPKQDPTSPAAIRLPTGDAARRVWDLPSSTRTREK